MPAIVQRPAPAFKADAVVEGLFQEVSLSDYLGKWYRLSRRLDKLTFN